MTRAALVAPYSDDGRAAERRFTVAVGASLVIHALVVASLRGLLPPLPAQDLGAYNNFATLQAILAGPRIVVEPVELSLLERPAPPALLLPPLELPLETTNRRSHLPALAPPPGPLSRPGTDHPPISISIKLIDDPSQLGAEYALLLAQKYSRRASKAPALLGSLAVVYPRAALDAGAEGSVAALITLDAQGRVVDAKLLPEDGLFAPAVAEAIKSAEFTPAETDGKPVPYWAIVQFYFSVAHPAATHARHPSVGR